MRIAMALLALALSVSACKKKDTKPADNTAGSDMAVVTAPADAADTMGGLGSAGATDPTAASHGGDHSRQGDSKGVEPKAAGGGMGSGGGKATGRGSGARTSSGTHGGTPPEETTFSQTPKGDLTAEEINRVVKAQARAFRACYEQVLARTPGIGGKVIVNFQIGGDGTVKSSKIASGSTMRNEDVGRCVKSNIMRLKVSGQGRCVKRQLSVHLPSGWLTVQLLPG